MFFTETNGQIASIIINVIIIILSIIHFRKKTNIRYYGYFLLVGIDIFINTIFLGWVFRSVGYFIYYLFNFSFYNLLLMILNVFVSLVSVIVYMILLVYEAYFIESFYRDDE